jgi:hypothetical protein
MLGVQQFLACLCFAVIVMLRRTTVVQLFVPVPSTLRSSRHCYTRLCFKKSFVLPCSLVPVPFLPLSYLLDR